MKALSIIAVGALLASAPVAAQQQGHQGAHQAQAGEHGAMHHCAAMMGGPHPQMLLNHGEALGLTSDQVGQLEALRDEAKETAMPHMQPAMQAHGEAADLLKADSPDFQAYEAKLREAADHMVRAHAGMARVGVQARQVLTEEQHAELEKLGSAKGMMRGGQHGMEMGEGGHGAMAGGGMAGMMMMMGCPMMEMGEQSEGGHNH